MTSLFHFPFCCLKWADMVSTSSGSMDGYTAPRNVRLTAHSADSTANVGPLPSPTISSFHNIQRPVEYALRQQIRRRHLNCVREDLGDLRGLHLSVGLVSHANDRQFSARDFQRR